jgi:uncharacterized protein YhaN
MELLVEQQQQQIHQLLAEQAALRQQADLCQQQVAEFEQLAKVAEAAAAHWRAEATEVSQPLQLIVEQSAECEESSCQLASLVQQQQRPAELQLEQHGRHLCCCYMMHLVSAPAFLLLGLIVQSGIKALCIGLTVLCCVVLQFQKQATIDTLQEREARCNKLCRTDTPTAVVSETSAGALFTIVATFAQLLLLQPTATYGMRLCQNHSSYHPAFEALLRLCYCCRPPLPHGEYEDAEATCSLHITLLLNVAGGAAGHGPGREWGTQADATACTPA